MEKINDRNIYISIAITTLVLGIFCISISLYSRLVVEPKAEKLISLPETMKQGYILLREPQLFAGYKYWDSEGLAVENSLRYFDFVIANDGEIKAEERPYLELILNRRRSGSTLGIKTAIFLFIVSSIAFAAFIFEQPKKSA